MKYTTTGRWLFSRRQVSIASYLILAVVWVTGCSPSQPSSTHITVVLSPQATAPTVSIDRTATGQPTTYLHGYRMPAWSRVEFPPGCHFHELSPDLHWVLLRDCRATSGKSSTDWIAQVNDQGELINSVSLDSKFTLVGDNTYVVGFASDSSWIILWRNGAFQLINPSDLTEQPYLPGLVGSSGINSLGSERWSPDGHLYLTLDRLGLEEIGIASPDHGTEEILIKNRGRHGTQVNWCTNNNEIVYVDGYVGEKMRAQLMDLQSRQSRPLIESQFPSSITGASCSPNGKWIAAREQSMTSNETTLWLIERGGGSKSRFVYTLGGSPDAFGNAWRDMVWSPDGSKLALRGTISKTGDGFIIVEVPTGKVVFQGNKGRALEPLVWSVDNTSLLALGYRSNKGSIYLSYFLEWITVQP